MKPSVSIIIPTFNEEKYLPLLLGSIKKQTVKPLEVIVADNASTDQTRQITKSFGAKVVSGGLPAAGRNNGAKVASGEFLLFLDADVVIPENFVEEFVANFQKSNLAIASTYFRPMSKRKIDIFLHWMFNKQLKALEKVQSVAPGFCLLTRTDIHKAVGGFDERIVLAEDVDYVRRVKKIGKFEVLRNPEFLVSVRRFDRDGRLNIVVKYLQVMVYMLLVGKITTDRFKYGFGHS